MYLITSNESNPATLKIIAALKQRKATYSIRIVTAADKTIPLPQRLPFVVYKGNVNFFSSNAVLQTLIDDASSQAQASHQWLEFESLLLSPNVTLAIAAKSNTHKALLKKNLTLIDEYAKTNANADITTHDISIWSSLYGLYMDESLQKEYLSELPNLLQWMTNMTTQTFIQDALNEYKLQTSISAYQALLAGAKYATSTTGPANGSVDNNEEIVTIEELAAAKESWLNGNAKLPAPKPEPNPVLPVPGEKNILITSALPYVNNVPHLGNIIGCVLSSDVFARFSRLCNWNTLFIGGTDEYGTATETKALEERLTPQQICDKYFEIHNSIYRWFNIGFDYFGRTTTPEQTKLVQEMFNVLNSNGFIETQAVEQLLCEKCNRFLADRFVEGGCPHPGCNYEDARGDQCDGCGKLVNAIELKDPKCKVCRSKPVVKISNQFFFQLNKVEPLLFHWIKDSCEGWTNNAKVITQSWMKEGLKPRCITRDLKWGVPVPVDGFRDKVFYVWFDAPFGYVSMTERYTKEWRQWWQPAKDTKVSLYQFMGKDNVPFHSVMFPGCLLGAKLGYTLVSHIMATEYVNYEDGKFSKSRGVGVFGNDAQDTGIPSDIWRFYLLYIRPEGQDTSFSWNDLALKNNSELLNNFGNFVNRALVFTEKFFKSTVPAMNPSEDDYNVLALCARELKGYCSSLEKCKLRDGIRHILAISKHGNQYMQATQPWVLLKGTKEDIERAGTVVGICVNITCLLATMLFPYMPDSSRNLRKQLNAPKSAFILLPENPSIVQLIPSGHVIGKPAPLFEKLEAARIDDLRKRFGGAQQKVAGGDNGNVAELEKAVQAQADKVRIMKSTAMEKSKWQPEVAILQELKKKLEAAQKAAKTAKNVNGNAPVQVQCQGDVANLEKAVQEQGDKVRALKGSGVEKSMWQPEVKILQDLKKQLEIAQKESTPSTISSNKVVDVRVLEENVEKQGQLVRKLKEGGAAKSEWQPQVDILLDLKKQLATATGQPISGGKSKGKK